MLAADINRILIVLAVAVVAGWLIGNIPLALAVAFGLYCVWLQRQTYLLLDWIRDRKHAIAPDPRGVLEDICREIDFLRERHKKRKKKLGNYIKQFQRATRALPDSTIVLDEDGAVQWANKAAAEVLGVRWPEDGKQRITNLIRDPALVDFIESGTKNASMDISSPLDSNVRLNVRLNATANDQRLFVARDMSDLHRANQIRSDFVANVSHELRTPITVLKGYLENLDGQREQCPPHWHTALDQMSEHVERMRSVVEDLLMLSKLEQSARVEDPVAVPVAELITDIHRQSQKLTAKSERIFALDVDTQLVIRGAPAELSSCFSNLVFNAIRYTEERGVIEISWFKDDDGAHFVVRDNGIGIATEHLERITERFYRIDSSRARDNGGTGLGLAIVKHILERHGAKLRVESELEKGSTFCCDFPLSAILMEDELTEGDVEIDRSA